ncbi:MAG: LacI family DNA-binding transcriptional regulator [Bacteroidales bacterium]
MSNVRIKDIARLAGVSPGTVDRVIHNRGEVSPVTRDRIRRLLKEHAYTPDAMASKLSLKKQFRFAVLMPGQEGPHAFWSLPRHGVDRALHELSPFQVRADIHEHPPFRKEDFLRLVADVDWTACDGVLFAPVFPDESVRFVERLRDLGVPVVLFNSHLECPDVLSYVGQDAFRSGRVGAHLMQYGLNGSGHLALVNVLAGRHPKSHVLAREAGFRDYFGTQPQWQGSIDTVNLMGEDLGELGRRMDELLDSRAIDGIFVTSSRVHVLASYLADRKVTGLRLGGYDLVPGNLDHLREGRIDFLISQHPEEQAFKGLVTLFQWLAHKREPSLLQWMPIDIITRENMEPDQNLQHMHL